MWLEPLADATRLGYEAKIGQGLKALVAIEEWVQRAGGAPEALEVTPENVRTFFLAWQQELHELMNEFPNWKPWKPAKTIDKRRIIDEYADVLAFQALITSYIRKLGITPFDLTYGFINKSKTNVERLQGRIAGYGWGGPSRQPQEGKAVMTSLNPVDIISVRDNDDTVVKARRKAGLNQRQLAQALGISEYLLSKYELGTRPIPSYTAQQIANITGEPVFSIEPEAGRRVA